MWLLRGFDIVSCGSTIVDRVHSVWNANDSLNGSFVPSGRFNQPQTGRNADRVTIANADIMFASSESVTHEDTNLPPHINFSTALFRY